jgi:hypothetical protein
VHQATKEIPPAMATGQAAGVAAALAARTTRDVRGVDTEEVRRILVSERAILA